jgi:hypothetical protein
MRITEKTVRALSDANLDFEMDWLVRKITYQDGKITPAQKICQQILMAEKKKRSRREA